MLFRPIHLTLFAATLAIACSTSSASVKSEAISFGFEDRSSCSIASTTSNTFDGPHWGALGPYYPVGYFATPAPDKGTVKLVNADRDADVYIDQAYAGKAAELKRMSIKPGGYDLELHLPDGKAIKTRIRVFIGKTLKLEF